MIMTKLPPMTGANRPTRPCACGCGRPTKSTWYPGDDGRATGWALRVSDGRMALGDVPANERAGAAIMLVRRHGWTPAEVAAGERVAA